MSCHDILIVEDNQDIREGFALILKEEGYRVTMADNGKTALNILLGQKPHVPGCIILDLMMPIMDGRAFLETLHREHPEDLCKIPIILATALGSGDEDYSELPCLIDKIPKPLDIDQLIGLVHKHCGTAA